MTALSRPEIYAFEQTVAAEHLPAHAATSGQFDSTLLRGVPLGLAAWATNDAGDLVLFTIHPSEAVRVLQAAVGQTVDGAWSSDTLSELVRRTGINTALHPVPSEAQIRAAVERALGAWLSVPANAHSLLGGIDPRGLTIVLPQRTELPGLDIATGRRTARVQTVTSKPPAAGEVFWRGATGAFNAPQAKSRSETIARRIEENPATRALVAEVRAGEQAVERAVSRVSTTARIALGVAAVVGVVWLFDRTRAPAKRVFKL